MKKHIIYSIIFSCALLFVFQDTYAQKSVYWLHGLNSDNTYWYRYRESLVDQLYRGQKIDYSSNNSINSTAQTLVNSTAGYSTTGHSILIGHSAGGLVSRSIQQIHPGVKGIITLGTPNQGANVVKELSDGSMDVFISDIIIELKKLSSDCDYMRRRSYLYSKNSLGNALRDFNIFLDDSIIAKIVELKPKINEGIDAITTQNLASDMHPESSYIKAINKEYIDVPIVNIAGYETDSPLLRLASTYTHLNWIKNGANVEDYGFDEEYIKLATLLQTLSNMTTSTLENALVGLWWIGLRATAERLIAAIDRINGYIQVGINGDYSDLIGAYHYEGKYIKVPVTDDSMISDAGGNQNPGLPIVNKPIGDREEVKWEWKWVTTKVYDRHDGLVSDRSTQIPDSLGRKVKNITIQNLNHLEMCGHKEVREELTKMLNGTGGYDPAFEYKNRN